MANKRAAALGRVENTSKSVWRLAWSEQYFKWTIAVLVSALFLGFGVFYAVAYLYWPMHIYIIPVLPVAFYWGRLGHKVRKLFLKQFAQDNGYTYEGEIELAELKGQLFEVGRSKRARYVVRGTYVGYPMRLFNYEYTVGSGKHSKTYNFTVFEITFDGLSFPHVVLQARSMGKRWDSVSHAEQVPLEEEFKDSFKLYVARGYEVEAMQIFGEETLRFLEKKSSDFSIEFADDRLYIYDDKVVTERKDLDEMHAVVRELMDRRGAFIKRLADDFASLEPYYER